MNSEKEGSVEQIDDFGRYLELLREYTEKLRVGNEVITAHRNRYYISVQVATFFFVASLVLVFVVPWQDENVVPLIIKTLLLLASGFPLGYLGITIVGMRNKQFFDLESVSGALIRLIRLSSQYHDHAKAKPTVLFELELRLAEAEAAVKVYQRISGGIIESKL